MRTSGITRNTKETKISLSLNLDGSGKNSVETGCGFLDHMLAALSKHSKFDLYVTCKGDNYIDYHHTTEDVGISLGKAFKEAVGDKRGIKRFADSVVPMDEALVMTSVDISGRSYLSFDVPFKSEKIGDFDVELIEEFFVAFATNAEITLHVKEIAGTNSHHIAECAFKSLARTLRSAVAFDEDFKNDIPSTKGVL